MKNIIESLSFRNFRNLEEDVMFFSPDINIIYGDNGMGKTNIIETIFICSTGRSHRTHKISSLINYDKKFANIVLYKNNGTYKDKINISLKENERKGVAINGIPLRRISDLFGNVKTVMFSPEDMSLINEGPGARRRFMDMELCQLSRVYCDNLEKYFKVLKQRNNLLKNSGDVKYIKDSLYIWDKQLVEYGVKIIRHREEFINKISVFAGNIYAKITGDRERLGVYYRPESLADELEERLKKSIERDIFYKMTNNGPHKDDILLKINDKDVRMFGSQGQKKSAVLALKLSETDVIKEETGELPVLLLDDVMSELDRSRQEFILDNLKGMQIIMTCTGIDDLVYGKNGENKAVFFVNNGKITVKK